MGNNSQGSRSHPSIRAVVFDMDGLMFDTERLTLQAWVLAGKEFDYEIDAHVVVRTAGMDHRDTELILIAEYGSDFPYSAVRARRHELVDETIARDGVPVKEGLQELLDWLLVKDLPLGVCTSTEKARALRHIEEAGFVECFQTVVGGDEVDRGKPEPDIYLLAAARLSAKPENVLVLEDSESGLRSANAAGMTTLLIPDLRPPSDSALAHADIVCTSLLEVQRAIENRLL